jgi:hypothetical protein
MVRSTMVTLAVLTSVLAGAQAAAADDGRYTVHGCPTGKLGATEILRGGWMANAFPETASPSLLTCGPDGVFGMDASRGMASAVSLSWFFLTPEAVTIDRIRLERRVDPSTAIFYSLQTDKGGVREQSGTVGSSVPIPPADWGAATYALDHGQWLGVSVTCISPAPCAPTPGPTVGIRDFQADLVDAAAPTIQSYSLSVDAPPPARPATLTLHAVAADKGSGVKSITALIDGQIVAQRTDTDGTCATPYPVPGPCPLTSTLDVPIARDALERGTGVLELEPSTPAATAPAPPACRCGRSASPAAGSRPRRPAAAS